MRKILTIIILVGAFIVGYRYSNNIGLIFSKIPIVGGYIIPENSTNFNIKNMESELANYRQKQHQEELRKKRLEELQSAEILEGEFQKVGSLVVYRGKMGYADVISENGFFWQKREMYLDLIYRFGIAIDFSNIIIKELKDGVLYIEVSKKDLYKEYCELEEIKNHKTNSTLLMKDFSSEDTTKILMQTKKATEEAINKSENIFNVAFESLQEQLSTKIDEISSINGIQINSIQIIEKP